MPVADESMEELKQFSTGAQEMTEAGITYVYLPGLKLPCAPGIVDGLLCVQQHGGYTTRLFLSVPVHGKGQNWTTHVILSRTWHTCSWNNVPANQRPAEILAQHLRAFR
jgi:hypothetical protein